MLTTCWSADVDGVGASTNIPGVVAVDVSVSMVTVWSRTNTGEMDIFGQTPHDEEDSVAEDSLAPPDGGDERKGRKRLRGDETGSDFSCCNCLCCSITGSTLVPSKLHFMRRPLPSAGVSVQYNDLTTRYANSKHN